MRDLRAASRGGGAACGDAYARARRPGAAARYRALGLGLHPPRSPQLYPRDERLQPPRERARLLPAGPPPPHRHQSPPLLAARRDHARLRRSGMASGSTGARGTIASGRCWMDRLLRICPAPGCRWRFFISPCTRTGRRRWKATTTAATGRTRPLRLPTARPSSRRRGKWPSISPKPVGATRSSSACSTTSTTTKSAAGPRLLRVAPRRTGQLPGLLGAQVVRRSLSRRRRPGRGCRPPCQDALPRRYLASPVAARPARRRARLQRRRRRPLSPLSPHCA